MQVKKKNERREEIAQEANQINKQKFNNKKVFLKKKLSLWNGRDVDF